MRNEKRQSLRINGGDLVQSNIIFWWRLGAAVAGKCVLAYYRLAAQLDRSTSHYPSKPRYNSPYLSHSISPPLISPSMSTLGNTASTLTASSKPSPTSSPSPSISHSAGA